MNGNKIFSNILATLLGIIIAIVLLFALELGVRLVDSVSEPQKRSVKTYHHKEKYRTIDDYGLLKANEGNHQSYKRYKDTKEYLFRVTYSIDEYGRRITPIENREQRDKYILFAGGSFTYGSGVENVETLPYQVGLQTNSYVPYNYGFHGWGPYDVLTKLRNYDLRAQIPERDGMMFYVMIGGHISRVTGSMVTMRWKDDAPYYVLNDAGEFERRGSFESGRPAITTAYKLLRKSALLGKLGIDLPILGARHFELVAKSIAAIRDEYIQQFPEGQFYVVSLGSTQDSKKIVEQLAAHEIEAIKVPDVYGPGKADDPRYYIAKEDKHPSPLSYKEMAAEIVEQLQLR